MSKTERIKDIWDNENTKKGYVAHLYLEEEMSGPKISDIVGVSRSRIYQILEGLGIDRGYNQSNTGFIKYSKKNIRRMLREFYDKHGKSPSASEWDKTSSPPCSSTISKRFGGWVKALTDADLPGPEYEKEYSDEELIGMAKELFESGDYPSASRFAEDNNLPSPRTIMVRWGSWCDYLSDAGVEPKRSGSSRAKTYSNEFLIDRMSAVKEIFGGDEPTVREWDKKFSPPSSATIRSRFGGWTQAWEIANGGTD